MFAVDINEALGKKLEQDYSLEYGRKNIKFLKCDVTNHQLLKGRFWYNLLLTRQLIDAIKTEL